MQTKIVLPESDTPTHWYNVIADMPNPPVPPLGADGEPDRGARVHGNSEL